MQHAPGALASTGVFGATQTFNRPVMEATYPVRCLTVLGVKAQSLQVARKLRMRCLAATLQLQVPAIDSTDDDNPLFASNDFRMLYMKVRRHAISVLGGRPRGCC